MEQQGLDLRKDLLANLGPKLAFYTQSDVAGESSNAAGLAVSRAAGSTFSVELRDRDRVARAIDPFMRSFGPFMKQRFQFRPAGTTVADRSFSEFPPDGRASSSAVCDRSGRRTR